MSTEEDSSDSEFEQESVVPAVVIPYTSEPVSPPSSSHDLRRSRRTGPVHSFATPKRTVRVKKETPSKGLPAAPTASSAPHTPYSMRSRDKVNSKLPPFIAVSRLEVEAMHQAERAQTKLENLIRQKHIVDLQRTLDSDESLDVSAAAAPDSRWGAHFGGTSSTDSTPEHTASTKLKGGKTTTQNGKASNQEKGGMSGKAEVPKEEEGVFGLREAPVFYPTAAEFADPTSFLDRIQPLVEPYGICRIVPPKEWNRDVWRTQINPSTFSFNTKSQSVHYLENRNGDYTQFMVKLQYFWTTVARNPLEHLPEIDGTPVDLYALYCLVNERGGPNALKDDWESLLPMLHINPDATYGGANLTQIYRKYLVPFERYLAENGSLPKYESTYRAPTRLDPEGNGETPRRNGEGKRSLRNGRGSVSHAVDANRRVSSSNDMLVDSGDEDNGAQTRNKRAKMAENGENSSNTISTAETLDGPVGGSVLRALMKINDNDPKATYGAYGSLGEEVSAAKAGQWRSVRALSFVPEQDASFVFCFYCRKGDRPSTLVLCDSPGCSGGAHLRCMNPPMTRPPHGKYYCPSCRGEEREDDKDAKPYSTLEEKPAFQVIDPNGREVSGLDLPASLGFGHGPGKRYTLAEFKEMALKFATYWFGKRLNSFAALPSASPPRTPAASPPPTTAATNGTASKAKNGRKSPNGTQKAEYMENGSPHSNGLGSPSTPSPVRSTRTSTSLRNFSKDVLPAMVATAPEIESEYWRLVSKADRLVRVAYGSDVDVAYNGATSGFPLDVNGKTVGRDCPELKRWELSPSEPVKSMVPVSRNDSAYLRDHGWNLNSLPYVTLLRWLGESISGVTRPMLYIGMMFSSFCWHTEDNWLYSINYIHTGAPKRWYGVSGHNAERFESALRAELPHLFAAEPQILFQLTTVLNPEVLKRHGVELCTTLQKEGEFVVTFPRAYHSGFNCGFNVAESVNFATWRWLDWGLMAANHYRFVRSTVFAHEKFVWQAALNSSRITHLPFLISIYRHLVLYMKFARGSIQHLKQKGILALYHSSRMHYELISDPITGDCSIEGKKVPKSKAEADPAYVNLLDDGFEPEDPQCYVCGYDLYMHRVDCQCRSPRIPRCLKHGGHPICDCPNSRKFVSYRYTPSSVRNVLLLLESVLTKMGAPPPSDDRTPTKRGKKSYPI